MASVSPKKNLINTPPAGPEGPGVVGVTGGPVGTGTGTGTEFDEELLDKWASAKTKNPVTGKYIKPGGPLYQSYKMAHDKLLMSRIERPLKSPEQRVLERFRGAVEATVERVRSRQLPTDYESMKKYCVAGDPEAKKNIVFFEKEIKFDKLRFKEEDMQNAKKQLMWYDFTVKLEENIYAKYLPFMKKNGLLFADNVYDQEWIDAQMAYIKGLPKADVATLNLYCGTAHFYAAVNRFLRNPNSELAIDDRMTVRRAVEHQIFSGFDRIRAKDLYDDLEVNDVVELFQWHEKRLRLCGIPIPDKKDMERMKIKEAIQVLLDITQRAVALRAEIWKRWVPAKDDDSSDDEGGFETYEDHDQNATIERFIHDVADGFLNDIFYAKILKDYTRTIQRIIMEAPPVRKEFVVYRGVNDIYHQKGTVADARVDPVYVHDGLISTSLSPLVPTDALFMGKKEGGHMLRIRLLPNTRCLILFPVSKYHVELEVLLPHGTQFSVKHGYVRKYYRPYPTQTQSCLYDEVRRVWVTDMTTMPQRKAKSIRLDISSASASASDSVSPGPSTKKTVSVSKNK